MEEKLRRHWFIALILGVLLYMYFFRYRTSIGGAKYATPTGRDAAGNLPPAPGFIKWIRGQLSFGG